MLNCDLLEKKKKKIYIYIYIDLMSLSLSYNILFFLNKYNKIKYISFLFLI